MEIQQYIDFIHGTMSITARLLSSNVVMAGKKRNCKKIILSQCEVVALAMTTSFTIHYAVM